ncbi:MAG: hypothetical protein WCI77_06855 [Candidatus Omnitrophota bacterium]
MLSSKVGIILNTLKSKIDSSKGLPIFYDKNAKFENWLQVELCGILSEKCQAEIIPEQYSEANQCSYDISGEKVLIELKIHTTKKSASHNIKGIIKDIEKLKRAPDSKEKAIIFVAFPLKYNDKEWVT